MFEYFETQWLLPVFDRWQIFRNHPGYPNTNSNIESFNAIVKRDITERIKLSVSEVMTKLRILIINYSTKHAKTFATIPSFDKEIKEKADAISRKVLFFS